MPLALVGLKALSAPQTKGNRCLTGLTSAISRLARPLERDGKEGGMKADDSDLGEESVQRKVCA